MTVTKKFLDVPLDKRAKLTGCEARESFLFFLIFSIFLFYFFSFFLAIRNESSVVEKKRVSDIEFRAVNFISEQRKFLYYFLICSRPYGEY